MARIIMTPKPHKATRTSIDPNIDSAAGAPAAKIDEALATFLAALALMCARPSATANGSVAEFARTLTHSGFNVTAGKRTVAPSEAQRIVAAAQRAGLEIGRAHV